MTRTHYRRSSYNNNRNNVSKNKKMDATNSTSNDPCNQPIVPTLQPAKPTNPQMSPLALPTNVLNNTDQKTNNSSTVLSVGVDDSSNNDLHNTITAIMNTKPTVSSSNGML